MKIAQRFIAGLGNAIGNSPRSGRLNISPSPTQPSASRTRGVNAAAHPALKRWAIFNRPLRGRDGAISPSALSLPSAIQLGGFQNMRRTYLFALALLAVILIP